VLYRESAKRSDCCRIVCDEDGRRGVKLWKCELIENLIIEVGCENVRKREREMSIKMILWEVHEYERRETTSFRLGAGLPLLRISTTLENEQGLAKIRTYKVFTYYRTIFWIFNFTFLIPYVSEALLVLFSTLRLLKKTILCNFLLSDVELRERARVRYLSV
jgi:hypothetical protein